MTAQGTLAIQVQSNGVAALQQYSECRIGTRVLEECAWGGSSRTTASAEQPLSLAWTRAMEWCRYFSLTLHVYPGPGNNLSCHVDL